MTAIAAVREEVLRRADIAHHAEQAGFRHARGAAWHCGFHNDEHPSCSILNSRIRCWSRCSRSWNVIDLRMALGGGTYLQVLSELAAEHGVIWPSDHSHAPAEGLLLHEEEMREAQFFRMASECVAETLLNNLPEAVPERFGPTQFLLALRAANGGALLALYRDYCAHDSRLAAALVFAGERAWRRRCDALARFIAAGAEVKNAA